MNTHNFLSPPMMEVYSQSCVRDFWSPRCNFFKMEYNQAKYHLNSYSIQGVM